MPSVHHLYALVAWCSETGVSLSFTASTFQNDFQKRKISNWFQSFIDLKIQVQTRGSLVLARKDLGPNL
jgi:hypothetical protein